MANERYTWRNSKVGFYWNKVNPQLVGEELARIARAGKLTPEAVIERARDEVSVLHQAFEWDVDKAALEHLKEQARHMISSLRVVKPGDTETRHRAFFNVVNPEGHEYVTRTAVATNQDYRMQVFNDALRNLHRAEERLADIEGLEKEVAAVGRVIRKVEKQRKLHGAAVSERIL
jgi:hypothetical protein